MMDELKNYYEEFYINKNIRKSPMPFLTKLSVILSRFDSPPYQIVLELLNPNKKLLDVGCGSGSFAWKAINKFSRIYGIDISENAIKQALEKIDKRPDKKSFIFQSFDANKKFPFERSFFDAVTCLAVLEHMIYPPTILSEISRILKPNGELIILIPNDSWLPHRVQYLLGKIPASGAVNDIGVDWGHLHKFNKKMIANILVQSGFKIKNITCSGIFADFRKRWLSLLAGDIIIKAIKTVS